MDIVERLRVKWSAMGDMANEERAEAANKIEQLLDVMNQILEDLEDKNYIDIQIMVEHVLKGDE